MKPIANFDKVKAYENGSTQLPVGGYVLKITEVRLEPGENGNSDRIIVLYDVAEGEYTDFFKNRYESDTYEDKKWKGATTLYVPKEDGSKEDEWTMRKLKTFTNALEDSNDGYKWDWDENKWKNLLIGGVYGESHTIIGGKQVQYNELRSSCSVDDIRKGNYKIPKPKYKNGASAEAPVSGNVDAEGFMRIPDGVEEAVPFE